MKNTLAHGFKLLIIYSLDDLYYMNKKNKIKIVVNGKLLRVNVNFSIKNLIEKLKTPINKVAIELNEEIVDKKKLSQIYLKNKDRVEIVHFIGGG